MKDNAWDRMEAVISYSKMTIGEFATFIGLSRAEALYQIKRGKSDISRKMAERVANAFSDINFSWLYSGNGEMLNYKEASGVTLPLYNADIEADIRRLDEIKVEQNLVLPKEVAADFMLYYRGSAMGSKISPNSIVALKEIPHESIILGKDYVIQTKHHTLLRNVRAYSPQTGDKLLRLCATRREVFDDTIIERTSIERVFSVVAVLSIQY